MKELQRRPVEPHPWWKRHRWERVKGIVDLFGIVRQCQLCWLVEVDDILLDTRVRGPHTILRGGIKS